MEIITFCDDPDNAITYLIINGNECLIIDPANDVRIMDKYIKDKHVDGILLTHGHYDHFRKLNDLLKIHPTTVYLHPKGIDKLLDSKLSCAIYFGEDLEIKLEDSHKVLDNEELELANLKIKVLYLPGHTNCSVGYLIGKDLFSGDVLFSNSIGRYDLPTGSLDASLSTIRHLKKIDDDIIIHPGHEDSFQLGIAKYSNPYFN